MNIETGESLKIADEFATNINIYNDYVYYTDYDDYHNTPDNKAVKRIKFDGSEKEILLTESDDSFYNNMQIIDNYLYYDCNFNPLEGLSFYYSADIYKMDLDTLEKSEVITGINPEWIINKTSDGRLDLYITQRYGIGGLRDINGENKNISVHGGLWNARVAGINNENIYYNTDHLQDSFRDYGVDGSGMGVTNLNTQSASVFKDSDLSSSNNKILAEDCFYVNDNGTLYSIDLNSTDEELVKTLYNPLDDEYSAAPLYEVKGYLAYFDDNNDLVIDKDIIVRSLKSEVEVDDKELEEMSLDNNELKDVIAYVKEEVGKYTGDQVVFYDFDSDNNIYKFLTDYIESAIGYDYNIDTGEIICRGQSGIDFVINDNYRNISDTNNISREESDGHIETIKELYLNNNIEIDEPTDEVKKLAEGVFSECIDYVVSPGEMKSIDGIEIYCASVTIGSSEYTNKKVALGSNGKIYNWIEYIDNSKLIEESL